MAIDSLKFMKNLQRLLREKGISQAELSRRTEILPQNMNKYVKGRRIPSAANMIRIAEALEVSAHTLMGDEEDCYLSKDTLHDLFIQAFDDSKKTQIFKGLNSEEIVRLNHTVEEFGGWRSVSDFLTEELNLRKLGEKEYHRVRKEIGDQLQEKELFRKVSKITTKKQKAI